MRRRNGEPRHPHGDLFGPGRRTPAASNNGDLATPQPAVPRAETFPMSLGDLQRHIRAVPPPVGHQNTPPLPGPGNQPAGDGGGNLPRHGNDNNINTIDERGDHGGPLGSGIRHKRKPIQSDATLRGGKRAKRGNADDGAPGTGAARGRKQRQEQGSAPTPGQQGTPGSNMTRAGQRPPQRRKSHLAERASASKRRAPEGRSAVGRTDGHRIFSGRTTAPALLSPLSTVRSAGTSASAGRSAIGTSCAGGVTTRSARWGMASAAWPFRGFHIRGGNRPW